MCFFTDPYIPFFPFYEMFFLSCYNNDTGEWCSNTARSTSDSDDSSSLDLPFCFSDKESDASPYLERDSYEEGSCNYEYIKTSLIIYRTATFTEKFGGEYLVCGRGIFIATMITLI